MEERGQTRRWPRRRSLRADLTALLALTVLAGGGVALGYTALYDKFYSPAAFVQNYLTMLSTGHAADALLVPGVAVDGDILGEAHIAADASDALLRGSVLAPLGDVSVTATTNAGAVSEVSVSYTIGGHDGRSTFRVVQDGWIGIVPSWRFEQTPLSAIALDVPGSREFAVNGFPIDKRQITPSGEDEAGPVTLLTFTPGLYSVTVDTKTAKSSGTTVLTDLPLTPVPVTVTPEPTDAFTQVVQESVDRFLAACAKQEVMQPTGCPFGYTARGRVDSTPEWAIANSPKVSVSLQDGEWKFPAAEGTAKLTVDIRSLYDGSVEERVEEVHFIIKGQITILPDGRVSIRIAGVDPT